MANRIKVESQVNVYEIDGKDTGPTIDRPVVRVLSHWNANHLVVLDIDGKRYTVVASNLEAAIKNARNAG